MESIEINVSDEDDHRSRLVYKHNKGTVEIDLDCLDCLNSGSYFKDTIVEFYLTYLINEACTKEVSNRVHIFDTIFTKQLATVFGDDKIDHVKLRQIRKWFEDVDIFKKDFLIFPICTDNHWLALIACYPADVKPIIFEDKEEVKTFKSTLR